MTTRLQAIHGVSHVVGAMSCGGLKREGAVEAGVGDISERQ